MKFLFASICVALCAICQAKKIIHVGAIFNKENSKAEIAFKFAINRFNHLDTEYELQPRAEVVSEFDSFKSAQIMCSLVESGVSAVFGPESSKSNDIIESIAESLEMPQFQTFWNPQLTQPSPGIDRTINNLYPETKLLSQAMATLLKEMRWRSYIFLYEHEEGLIRLQEALKGQKSDRVSVRIKKLTTSTEELDYRPLLKQIKLSSELQIILDCETDHILNILQQAEEVNLLNEYYSYILTSLDAHTLDFSSIQSSRANITTLRLVDPGTKDIRNVVRDWEQGYGGFNHNARDHFTAREVLTSTALLYDAVNMFATGYKELDKTEQIIETPLSCSTPNISTHGMRLMSYLKVRGLHNGSLPGPLTGSINLNTFGYRVNFNLQIVELTTDGLRKSGVWNSNRPEVINFTFTQQERQLEIVQQLSQKVFKVASRIGAPYLMWKEPKRGERLLGNNKFEGYSMDLIAGVAEVLNFSYLFELVPDNNYGSYDPKTKEWDGLIRQLLDRKADLAVCDLTITYERRKAVDFTMPFMTLGISILYSKAVKPPPELFSFMYPLSLDIWLYMATAYLAISIIIYIAARLAPGDWENPHPCNQNPEELENIWDIKNCLWLTLGSLMAQGCDILPKGISTRMIAGMWWFFSLIMCASYTANLAAFLTMERMGPTVESAEDLAKQTKIKYGSVLGGATASFFRDSNFSTYHRMWTQMQAAEPSVFEKSNRDGVKRVKTSKRLYAFLMESSNIEYEMERDCELMQVGGWLDSKGYGIAMPVNSPYRTAISGAVLKMQEEGKLHKLKEKWWRKMHGGGKCSALKHSSDTAAELSIDNVGGIFVVLGVGILIAFLIAALEFMWNVRKIAVNNHKSIQEVVRLELKFAMNVSDKKKVPASKLSPESPIDTNEATTNHKEN